MWHEHSVLPYFVHVVYWSLLFVTSYKTCFTAATFNGDKAEFDLTLSHFVEGDSGSGGDAWSGYKFTVSYPVSVSALRGGSTGNDFELAMFNLTHDGNQIDHVLKAVSAPGGSRAEIVKLDTAIQLCPNEYYFIAQGFAGDSASSHYLVQNVSVNELISAFGFLQTWEPEDGRYCFFIGNAGQTGQASSMIGEQVTELSGQQPNIGFVASSVEVEGSPCPTPIPVGPTLMQLAVQWPRRAVI